MPRTPQLTGQTVELAGGHTPIQLDQYMRETCRQLHHATSGHSSDTISTRIDEAVVSSVGWFKLASVIKSVADAFEKMLNYVPTNLIRWCSVSAIPAVVNPVQLDRELI